MASSPNDAKRLITKYLSLLRDHVEKQISNRFEGRGIDSRDIAREYMITVPAVWPELAQEATRICAKEAGMACSVPVEIMTEPEAAGIYALRHMSCEEGLGVDDTFVICDAGGG